jgi:hypothetical protein
MKMKYKKYNNNGNERLNHCSFQGAMIMSNNILFKLRIGIYSVFTDCRMESEKETQR